MSNGNTKGTMPDQPAPLERASLAYENREFIDSPDGRLLRIIAEYQEPLARFRRERIADTIVFFGSARFHSDENETPHSIPRTTAVYYEDARTLARMVSTWAKTLPGPRHRFVVTSGGGPGIMEAANRGAWEAGARSIGLNIKLTHEQEPNRYITPALNFEFHYFFMRKYWFAYLAKALVVFPGGFGTLDELFEIMTLAQTNKLAKKIIVILYGTSYWRQLLNFDFLVAQGAISAEDLALFRFVDTPEEALVHLKEGLEAHMHAAPEFPEHVPNTPAPTAQDLLGPDIARTLP